MGNVFLVGGGMVMFFVTTSKGFQYRWYLVLIFLVLFAGVITFQIRKLNAANFNPVMVLLLKD